MGSLGLAVLQNMSNKFNSMKLIHIVQKSRKKMNATKGSHRGTNKSIIGIDPGVKLSLLWIFVALLMVYADIVSLLDPTSPIREVMAGAPLPAGGLLAGAVLKRKHISMF